MIGLPLRLLAREVYQRVVERVGRAQRRARHRRGEDQARPSRATGSPPSRRCRATSTCPSSPSTRSSSPRSRPRPRLHRPPAEPARAGRDAADRLHHHAAAHRGAGAGVHVVTRPRLSQLDLRGREEGLAPAPPHRHRRLLGRGGLRHRRADPAPERRRGGGARRALAPHPQRAGRALSVRATSIISSPPTRSAWGSISTSTMWRSRPTRNSTASASAGSTPAELAPDRRPRRAAHARRHVRHHRPLPALRRRNCGGAGEPQLRSGARSCNGETRISTSRSLARLREACASIRGSTVWSRADRRGPGGARTPRARATTSWRFARSRPRSNGSGRSARCRITGKFRRRSMPTWSARSIAF